MKDNGCFSSQGLAGDFSGSSAVFSFSLCQRTKEVELFSKQFGLLNGKVALNIRGLQQTDPLSEL